MSEGGGGKGGGEKGVGKRGRGSSNWKWNHFYCQTCLLLNLTKSAAN